MHSCCHQALPSLAPKLLFAVLLPPRPISGLPLPQPQRKRLHPGIHTGGYVCVSKMEAATGDRIPSTPQQDVPGGNGMSVFVKKKLCGRITIPGGRAFGA
ncbi:hypothetical protein AAHC03_024175 [Spirometra sp. Aus1]